VHLGLEGVIPYIEFLAFVAAFLLSVFWRPIVGIFFLLPLLPLQTIRYRLNELPLGGSVVGLVLLGVVLGLWRAGQPIFPRSPWTKVLVTYIIFTFGSLWFGSLYLGFPSPSPGDPRFAVWQDYIEMPFLLLLTAACAPSRSQMRLFIFTMCITILAVNYSSWSIVSGRDFSTYSDDLRDGGSMGYAGSNGLAAFEAQAIAFLAALAAFERRSLLRLAYYGIAAFSVVCLMYSLSRGGYVALLAACLFLGLAKQRMLLVFLVVLLLAWTNLVPMAVQQRISMTYDEQTGSLDNSAETRLSLWENAMQVFGGNVVFGTGFNTYAYMHLNKRTDGGEGYYEDTHNFFIKVLLETGIAGLAIFIWLLGRTALSGFRLFRKARDPFFASLGLGLVGWLVSAIVANLFGDRWTFLQVNSYMWILGGLVSHALVLEENQLAVTLGKLSAEGDDSATHVVPEFNDHLSEGVHASHSPQA
jgi:putative inorganic carbon (HCO3(-)) transporter